MIRKFVKLLCWSVLVALSFNGNAQSQEASSFVTEGFYVKVPNGDIYLFPVFSAQITAHFSRIQGESPLVSANQCVVPPAPGFYQFSGKPGWRCLPGRGR